MTTPRFSFFSTSFPNIEGPFSWDIPLYNGGFIYLRYVFCILIDSKLSNIRFE